MRDETTAVAVLKDARSAPLEPRDRALVEYALALTLEPSAGARARLETLRAAGFSDEALLAATEVVAYFNFVNRLAEGLGVELEPDAR